MKTVIDFAIGAHRLTNQTPSSRYGLPVLHCWDGRDCKPADVVPEPEGFRGMFADVESRTAADVVRYWMRQEGRTTEEKAAAEAFLSQSPQ